MWRVSQVNIEKFQSFQAQEHGLLAKDRMEPKPFIRKAMHFPSVSRMIFVSPQFIHSIIFAKAEYGWNCPCLVVTSTANFLALLSISWPARTARLSAKAVRAGLTPSLVWKAELSIQSLHSTGCTENALFQALKVLKLVWSYSSVETILCLCWGPISSG